jgi:hypothetical protein
MHQEKMKQGQQQQIKAEEDFQGERQQQDHWLPHGDATSGEQQQQQQQGDQTFQMVAPLLEAMISMTLEDAKLSDLMIGDVFSLDSTTLDEALSTSAATQSGEEEATAKVFHPFHFSHYLLYSSCERCEERILFLSLSSRLAWMRWPLVAVFA